MKVSLYCRESSDDTTSAPSVDNQIESGKQWAKEHNHEIIFIFVDNGYSGGDWNRPDWNRSLREAKRHSYQLLWVWNQDRIARDTEQFLFYYRTMKSAHVDIFENTSNELIDMESLGGRVKHQSLAQAAEIFRLVTSDKVKKKYIEKKKKGERWGRKQIDTDCDLIINLRNQGLGYRAISKQLGNISYQTVKRRLIKHETERIY